MFTPEQLLLTVTLLSGFLFGEGFKHLDNAIRESNLFRIMSPLQQQLIAWIPDLGHHFQYGLALMWFAYQAPSLIMATFLYNFGFGIVLADAKNYKAVLRRVSKSIAILQNGQKQAGGSL